jgi:hypothetical protein
VGKYNTTDAFGRVIFIKDGVKKLRGIDGIRGLNR